MASSISDLLQSYQQEFVDHAEEARQRFASLPQNVQEQLVNLQQNTAPSTDCPLQKITDLDTPIEDERVFTYGILPVYLWVSFSLVAYAIGYIIGGLTVVSAFLNLFMSGPVAITMAFFMIPAMTIHLNDNYIQNREQCQLKPRMVVLMASTVMGVLAGHALADCYMTVTTPPMWLIPFIISLLAATVGPKLKHNRLAVVAVLIGVPLTVELLFGLVTMSMGPTYLAFLLSAISVFFIELQINLGNPASCVDEKQTKCITQLIASAVTAQGVCTFMLSTTQEKAQQTQAQQQQ